MLQAHERCGDFEIIRPLGKGGMGEVYEARQFNPDRPVALKVLAPWLANDADALARFWREAQVPANLDHPGIVRIISTGTTADGVAYYTMHLVRGISLAQLIRHAKTSPTPGTSPNTKLPANVTSADTKNESGSSEADSVPTGPTTAKESAPTHDGTAPVDPSAPPCSTPGGGIATVSLAERAAAQTPGGHGDTTTPMLQEYRSDRYSVVARIGAQAARALAYAHAQGFLHRDIKPGNLMVDRHNHVYLVDFGLTRALSPDARNTQPGIVPGTPWYMSPEQANGLDLDARSDIYSLGVTLYEMATQGEGPFSARRDDKNAILTQVRSGTKLALRSLAPDVPPALERIILKAMHPRPDERYANAAELAHDLETLADSSAAQSIRSPEAPVRTPRGRWPVVALATALVLLVVAGVFLAVAPFRPEEPREPRLDGSKAWPDALRTAQANTPIALLKNNHEPVATEKLVGTGDYRTHQFQLELSSPFAERCTMLALADPYRESFEYSIELQYLKGFKAGITNDIGIFFGWRRQPADPDGRHQFFALKLDETPFGDNVHGRLIVGRGEFIEKTDARAEGGACFVPIRDEKANVPLPQPHAWHKVRVLVRPDGFTVKVGTIVTHDFPLTYLREKTGQANIHTDGAVGIWAARGRGFFRNAAITLPGK